MGVPGEPWGILGGLQGSSGGQKAGDSIAYLGCLGASRGVVLLFIIIFVMVLNIWVL